MEKELEYALQAKFAIGFFAGVMTCLVLILSGFVIYQIITKEKL